MKAITFAEDHPQAGDWFVILHQSFATATPGPRSLLVLAIERDVIAKLDAISVPTGHATPSGFQPRRLIQPCTLSLTETELGLLHAYLVATPFQPYLSATILDLLAALAAAPVLESHAP